MTTYRELPVRLEEDELKDRAMRLAVKTAEHHQLEQERQKVSVALRDRMKNVDYEIRKLTEVVTTGEEPQDVEIEYRPNFEAGLMEIIRLDTGEVIEERPLEDSERQMGIDEERESLFANE